MIPSYEAAKFRHSQRMERDHAVAYLQRGDLSQVSEIIPTIDIVSEKATTLGARQRVGDMSSTFEQRVDGYVAHCCWLLARAVVKC